MRLGRIIVIVMLAGMLAGGMTACLAGNAADDLGPLAVSVVSSRQDMVAGGDALLLVDVRDHDLEHVSVTVNGSDVTAMFRETFDGQFVGLVTGLEYGVNDVVVSANADSSGQALRLVNHSIAGPVFSGPHEQPFICETETFELVSGETLGDSLDQNCSIVRRVDYAYRSQDDDELKSLPNPGQLPENIATVTTLAGHEVPYVVRIETGTINRAVYQIAMLHTPGSDGLRPSPWMRSPGWNGRLIYTFGGGCVNGWYRQGNSTGGVTDDVMLRQGYAVASSSLNVYGTNCNDVLAAETMMMVKERFIEAYGVPRYTIGWGCSGGSYQNHQIADNYPGLLDGIIPGCSFPDVGFGTVPMITDARLLNRYFQEKATIEYSLEQQRAVAGFLNLKTMTNVSINAGRINVSEFCPDVLPEGQRYHATDNPNGARCDVYSHYINVYGSDSASGYARRPLDNVGIQYGLTALNDGVITPAQFLDLNQRIGGYDEDGNAVAERTTADLDAVRIAYETGRLTNGGGGLATTPIIDYRAYSDDRENGDVHVRYHSFSIRERLRKANGRTDNHVMLVEDDRHGLYSSQSSVLQKALAEMDQWLDNLSEDQTSDPLIDRVVRAKPATLVDSCWSRDQTPIQIKETQVRGGGRCEELYPSAPSPREVAGGPLAADIVKCQLKPVDFNDYAATFNETDALRLRKIFAGGVCDWTQAGEGQTALKGSWLRFGN
tara:strand:+ start:2285 stop:4441 length:2157 start_codon:yes stop_codon:yes gene_type:complete